MSELFLKDVLEEELDSSLEGVALRLKQIAQLMRCLDSDRDFEPVNNIIAYVIHREAELMERIFDKHKDTGNLKPDDEPDDD